VLIFFRNASDIKQKELETRGVHLVSMGHAALPEVVQRLAEMQITSVLLEGGAGIYTNALNQGLADKLMLFYAPRFLGEQAVPMLGPLEGLPSIQEYSLRRFGQDFALEAYLRNPWLNLS
jgi:diaminohydroxyphosphoribosylaminopyrimidine deaminase/5-amino-6-(5-phosphoribosylamino)uracil reductase